MRVQPSLRVLFAFVLSLVTILPLAADTRPPAPNWPQFRGPQGQGVAKESETLPTHFGPGKNVLWKTAVPSGVSSPCIWGDFVFLTGFDQGSKKLETLCLDRRGGQILWRRAAPAETIEKVHAVSSPANATPTTDGERVYVYFGSYGLLAYDFQGSEQWKLPLPLPSTRFGTGSSPVTGGGWLFLNCDFPPKPYLLAVDCRNGKIVWKQDRLPFADGYATPVLYSRDGQNEVLIHSMNRLTAYNRADGKEAWWLNVPSAGSTPVAADGRLFVASFSLGREPSDQVKLPTFEELLKQYDKNKDGRISKEEFPPDLSVVRRADAGDIPGSDVKLILFYDFIVEKSKDHQIGPEEWNAVLAFGRQEVEHGVLAIKPGGHGDVSKTNVLWREKSGVPEIPSPLYYRDRLYTVRDGGIVSCLEPNTGKLLYRERLGPAGAYFSSPVGGDGKIYCASQRGVVVVLAAGDSLKVMARNVFQESIVATPALVDGKFYLRTANHLYAFTE